MTHRRAVVITAGVIFVVSLLLSLLFRVDSLNITRLNISSDNLSVSIDGSTLRAYNGAFFYKRSLTEDTTPKVLGGGVKLPGVTHALWANDSGAILNFDQSLIGTAVEAVANKENLSYAEKTRSTWYFDFSDNSLHQIGDYLLYSDTHYFDSKSSTLYYLEADEGLSIHAFNTKTKQDHIIPLTTIFGTISYLDKCFNSDKLCVIGNTLGALSHTEIYSIEDSGQSKKEFSIDGEFHPVLGTSYGLALENRDLTSSAEDPVLTEYEEGSFLNLKTGEKININQQFTANGALYTTYGDKGDKLAIIGGLGESYTTVKHTFWGSATRSGRLTYDNGDKFDSATIIDATPTKNSILLKTTDGEYGVFAENGYIKGDFSIHPLADVKQYTATCTDDIGNIRTQYDDETSEISILIPDNATFASNVTKITNCISKKADLLYGYSVSFVSYDPKSGRATSY